MWEIDRRRLYKEDLSILSTDYTHSLENFKAVREAKGKVYHAFSEYIECLENSLQREEDLLQRSVITKKIKKLKKEQKKYYVPSVLEIDQLDSNLDFSSSKRKGKWLKRGK